MANFNATKGSTSANSYATTTEADDYLEYSYGAEDWADLDDDEKEKLLVSATRMIDGLRSIYKKADDTQALNFPMNTGDSDNDGFSEAKKATIIQALHLYRNHDAIAEAKQSALMGTKTESLGKVSRTMSGYNGVYSFDPMALQSLKGLIDLKLRVSR